MVPKTLFQGLIQFYMGEIEEAKALFEESAEHLTGSVREHPKDCVVRSCLGISFAGIGDHKRAIECCEESEKIEPCSRSAIYGAVPIPYTIRALVMIGEYNLALERLEKFVDSPQDEWSGLTLGMDPAFDPLHDDPRFKTLVQRRH
jgi:tetratricopeptide (TPR) repeat protein